MPPAPAARPVKLSRLWASLLIFLLAIWLRAPAVWQPAPLDVDEALYATYGRQISHENAPLLAGSPVDKPPLGFYVLAGSFKLFGQPSAWAARLPGLFASLLTIAALWRLALSLYHSALTASLAALLLALSPLDISYAGTVFLDPGVTLWMALALLAVSHGRWGVAGALAGLAFATKQSALLYAPLVLALGLNTSRPQPKHILRFVVVYGVVCALPFIWDIARPDQQVGWWVLGAANNAPDRLIRSDEVLPRLRLWGQFLSSASGTGCGLGLAVVGALFFAVRHRHARLRAHAFDLIWLVYTIGYSLLYGLVAFSLYPRYAHLLAALLALLAARVITQLYHSNSQTKPIRLILAGGLLVFAAGIPHSLAARTDPAWLRPARERHAGIETLAAYLNTLPPGTIVYDHWAGWLLGWYTGQDRPPDMWQRVVYYPTPEQLIRGALAQPDPQPRYFVAPEWAPTAPWIAAMQDAGFAPRRALFSRQFSLYALQPP